MLIEGKGLVAPSPVAVNLSPAEIRMLEDIAARRNRHRGYSSFRSQWKKGNCTNPVLTGLGGEYATQIYLTNRVKRQVTIVDDMLNDGDGGIDILVFNCKYQVKTATKIRDTLLVKRVDHKKRLLKHVSSRYVFCSWEDGSSVCHLLGWCSSETLTVHGTIHRPRVANGNWWNVELQRYRLESMESLVRQINQDREECVPCR